MSAGSIVLPTPTAVEIMVNLLLGVDATAHRLPDASGVGVRAAMEQAILPALLRPPCFVSFSGGRDSSAILAVAVATARRHGLDLPIPAVMRYPGMPETDETHWQELVLEHLKGTDPVPIILQHENEALGEAATRLLQRDGVRWPGNAHMHVPIYEVARGGSILTGVGGDELLQTKGSRWTLIFHGRARPSVRDIPRLAYEYAPRWLRARAWRRFRSSAQAWFTQAGQAVADDALARDYAAWPNRWDRALDYWTRTRAHTAVRGALAVVAARYDVQVVNPFVDPFVLAEMLVTGGATGFADRAVAMDRLFGDLLPHEVISRSTKAGFSAPIWGPLTREFVRDWNGHGVDSTHVDAESLRREWLSPAPNFNTILLLHSAWLASVGSTEHGE